MTPYCDGIRREAELLRLKEAEYRSTYLVSLQFIHHTIDAPHNGYFDETIKDDIIGVAGWIGTFEGWNSFEDRWKKELPQEANGDFHYTDFWHDPKHYAAKWSHERRLEHIQSLARITHDGIACGVGYVFSRTLYDELIPPKEQKSLISPLHFCLANCMVAIIDFYKTLPSPPPPPLRIMFDRKREEQESIGKIYYQVKSMFDKDNILGNISFGDRYRTPPLQAADLFIGELRRRQAGYESKVFDVLCEKRPLFVAFPNEQELREHITDALKFAEKNS